MKIGLFDLYATGHHLPYANTVQQAVDQFTEHEVDFITLTATERQSDYFAPENIVYLDPPGSPKIEEREEDFTQIAEEKVSQLSSLAGSEKYDVVHFLYIDDILGPVQRHWTGSTSAIGDLIGPFFTRGTVLRNRYTHPLVLKILQSPVAPALDFLVPEDTSHQAMWRDLLLYRSMKDEVFDEMLLHSVEAQQYVDQFGFEQQSTHIPFPVPTEYRAEFTQAASRQKLGLPESGTILLFFGTLRSDKGIQLLLDAMRKYSGPEFTLLIAGPPVATTAEEIEETDRESSVNIISRLEFIKNPGPYYRAVNGVLMPYQWEFGKENMSMIFQEACGSLRPIITPDFGVLGRLTTEQNLGMTFEHDSAESLAAVIAEFVTSDTPFSEDQMERYANQHSKEKTVSRVSETYRKLGR
ncbi:glycosyltransferase [Halobacteriaceae archaeon SHR40]|uniref:glycosyltransferase n=1 Tax=Halovenus amylolytica TaxID=2500550 RepID=UPI000FE316B1